MSLEGVGDTFGGGDYLIIKGGIMDKGMGVKLS